MHNRCRTPFSCFHDRAGELTAAIAALVLFGTVLVGFERLGFRDGGHFYTPLYGYVGSRSAGDWIPLWNPLDQTGMPLLGETTTAFFYPPRYVMFLLPIAAETALGWYVAAHVVLAAGATSWVAGRAGRSAPSAAFAGVTYALSGPVLFLYCNPPFLVGAAWLPLVVGPLSETRASVWLPAVALAMMVLGGDPQTALHAGAVSLVVVAVRSVMLWRRQRKGLSAGCRIQEDGGKAELSVDESSADGGAAEANRTRWRALLFAPLVAAVLTAPQLAASIDWGRHSERFHSESFAERFRPPIPGSHRAEAFQFSVPPWRVAEFATPWAFGRLFPEHHRWSTLIPEDGRIWTPTLYMGLLPMVAVLCCLGSRRRGWDRWLGIAVGTLACAAGSFGAVWWIQILTGGLRDLDGAIGGPYWMLYQWLPGYAAFRYPAKWLPLFALAIAMVTARWLDGSVVDVRSAAALRGVRRGLVACGCALFAVVVIGVGLLLAPGAWQGIVVADEAVHPRDRFWGPLDLSGGIRDLVISSAGSLVVAAVVWSVIGAPSRSRFAFVGGVGGWVLVAVAAAELTVSASAFVARVPRGTESRLVETLQERAKNPLRERPGDVVVNRWMRTQSGGGWPRSWREGSDPGRMVDVEASQRAVWFGRWHLADGQAVFNNMTTLRSREIDRFWDAVGTVTAVADGAEREARWQQIRRWLAIDGVTHAGDETFRVASDGNVLGGDDDEAENADDIVARAHQLVTMRRWGSPLRHHGYRLHADWRTAVAAGPERDRVFREMLGEVIRLGEKTPPRVTGGEAVRRRELALTAGDRALRDDQELRGDADANDTIRVVRMSPEFAEVAVRSRDGGLLRRPTLQDGSWRATIRTGDEFRIGDEFRTGDANGKGDGGWREAPVHEVDMLAQGVVVPAGRSVVRFHYRPAWLAPSLTVAGAGWGTLLVVGVFRSTRVGRRRGRIPASANGRRP